MSSFRDPIFRGCTRPATFAGVPLLPLLLTTGAFLIADMWIFYFVSGYATLFLCMAYVPLFVTMREVTKKDDQRLHQLMLRAKMRLRQRTGHVFWGASSYSPLRYKRRSSP